MNEEERRELGRTRRLIFQNLANGVPADKVGTDLQQSTLQIEQATRFVARKITEYLVLRRQAPIPCDDVKVIRWHRRELLAVLARIGDLDLSSSLILSKITVQALDHPEMIEGASRRMAEVQR